MTTMLMEPLPGLLEAEVDETLDDLIVGLWSGIRAGLAQDCPLCGGAVRPVYAAHSRPIAGRCGECGSSLT